MLYPYIGEIPVHRNTAIVINRCILDMYEDGKLFKRETVRDRKFISSRHTPLVRKVVENVIHGPTRIGNTRLFLLDPVFVRECSIGNSEVLNIDRGISDHNATIVDIKINVRINTPYYRLQGRQCICNYQDSRP